MNILKDKNTDIILTYSWWNNDHGICGHIYECIEYYYHLIKFSNYSIKILFAEKWLNKESLKKIIQNKYSFNDEQIQSILENTIFQRPRFIICKNLFLVDGNLKFIKDTTTIINTNNIFLFGCQKKGLNYLNESKELIKGTIHALVDKRLNLEIDQNIKQYNYVKKVLLNKLLKPKEINKDYLLYLTSECRMIPNNKIEEISKKYKNIIILSDKEFDKEFLKELEINQLNMPLENIYDNFNSYIYTDVKGSWDCSSRFIVECKYFDKEVIYELSNDYYDLALEIRKQDLKYSSLELDKDDNIINIIKRIINE